MENVNVVRAGAVGARLISLWLFFDGVLDITYIVQRMFNTPLASHTSLYFALANRDENFMLLRFGLTVLFAGVLWFKAWPLSVRLVAGLDEGVMPSKILE